PELDDGTQVTGPAEGGQTQPRAAFDGTNYLVVWQDSRGCVYNCSYVYGARVSASGVLLDPTGIAIATSPGAETVPVVAFDGTNYLVVWEEDSPSGGGIQAARVTTAGAVVDPNGFSVAGALGPASTPGVAFDGKDQQYLVVWQDGRNATPDIYGAR